MKKTFVVIVVLLSFLGTAYALPGSGFRKGSRGGLVTTLLQLGLTAAQKHKVAVILKGYRTEVQGKADALLQARMQLRNAMERNEFNEAAVRSAYRDVAEAGESMAILKARMMADIRHVLTPEQLGELDKLRTARLENMKQRKGRFEQKRSLLDEWIDVNSQAG